MKFLTEFKDNQENILQILLVTINRYGDENMMINFSKQNTNQVLIFLKIKI